MFENVNEINEFLEIIENEISISFPKEKPENLYNPINYLFSVKGKRIRPLLTLLATGLVGGKLENALKPAVAFEFLHNFTLIHDDIMDKSPIRRGRETIHKKWNESIGILSGDLLMGLAFRKIIEAVDSPNAQKILLAFTDSLVEVCEGQGYDIDFELRNDITIPQYLMMIEYKTAKLLEKALVVGGLIGNGNSEQIEALSMIGLNLGLGFQLQDDLLDLTADVSKFGKEIGKDIKEGKKTFMMIKAKELFSEPEEVDLINEFYSSNGLEGEKVQKLINALRENGIFDLANEKIDFYFENINQYLKIFENNKFKLLLSELFNNIFNRKF